MPTARPSAADTLAERIKKSKEAIRRMSLENTMPTARPSAADTTAANSIAAPQPALSLTERIKRQKEALEKAERKHALYSLGGVVGILGLVVVSPIFITFLAVGVASLLSIGPVGLVLLALATLVALAMAIAFSMRACDTQHKIDKMNVHLKGLEQQQEAALQPQPQQSPTRTQAALANQRSNSSTADAETQYPDNDVLQRQARKRQARINLIAMEAHNLALRRDLLEEVVALETVAEHFGFMRQVKKRMQTRSAPPDLLSSSTDTATPTAAAISAH
ncbi:MAG: hypothetical protein HY939_06205 [Gammaproteobacteria bacterium]|nr:hypothetical protein [Gammaproteobacteria bacterium]